MAVRDLTLPSLGPRLAEFARRSGLAGMWTWWMAQLNALVPSRPRAALERRRMRPVLVFDGDHATLWRPAMDGERAVMRATTTIGLVGDAATVAANGRSAIATLADGNFGVDAVPPKVVLSLPPRDVLRKTVVLPAAVEPNLRQTLAYDLDRHTPFKAEELHFDAVVVGRSPEKKEIRVDLVSCRKAVVDAAMRHAAAWGATVLAAVPELPATASASRLNLLPHESRASNVVWKRWQFWLPLVLVSAVALAAIAIPLWQKRDFAIALNTLANGARSQAAVSDALRAELDTRAGDYNFALEKKYAYPSAFRVIDEVSRVLPDDTWLTQMEMKTVAKGKENQRELLVRGESANAGRLVQLVEESTLFAQTAPRSPTTKIQPGPGEIFDLGAQVKPLAAPAQVALLGAERSANTAGTVTPAANSPAAPAATPAAPAAAQAAPAATPVAPDAGTARAMEKEKGSEASAAPLPLSPPAASAPVPNTNSTSAPAPAVPSAATPAKPAATVPAAVPPPATVTKAQGPPPPGVPDPWLSAPRPKPTQTAPRAATPSGNGAKP
jgi:general secretion pathway protein L